MLINIVLKLFNCGDNFDSGISGEPISNCGTLARTLKAIHLVSSPKGSHVVRMKPRLRPLDRTTDRGQK